MGLGSTSSGSDNLGVYGYKDGFLHIKNTSSQGDSDVEFGGVVNIGDGEYITTWNANGSYGADLYSDEKATGYIASMETEMNMVGTPMNKKQFQTIDVALGKELATGQGIRISYRENESDSYTTIATFDYATYGAVSHMTARANMSSVSSCQIKVELTAASGSTDSPEFIGAYFS